MLYMQELRRDVKRMKLNDPSITTFRWRVPTGFNSHSFLVSLGQALEENTHLRHLTLLNLNLKQANVAQALFNGIGASKLESLSLSHSMPTLTTSATDGRSVLQATMTSIRNSILGREESEATAAAAESMQIWQSLFEGLQSSQTIQELSIGSFPTEGIVKVGEALPLMQSLRKLGFDELSLTEAAAQVLANGIRQSKKVERFELKGCIKEEERPTKPGCIRRIFYQSIVSLDTLQHLVLVDFPMEDLATLKEGFRSLKTLEMEALQKYTKQENESSLAQLLDDDNSFLNFFLDSSALMLSASRESTESWMTSLAQGLRCNESLTSLTLKRCVISPRDVNDLFVHGLNKINNNNIASLTHLKLHECGIGDDEIEALVDNWHCHSSIQCLSLQNNAMGPNGVQALLRAARNHPNLQMLDVSNNRNIGHEGLRLIGDDLPNQEYLTYLELSKCVNSHDEIYPQVWELADLAGFALLDGIQHSNSRIRHLNVRNNGLSQNIENEIHFHASANMGRYLMAADPPQGVALSVWSYILAKSAQQEQVQLGASVIFFYLIEQPCLVHL